jgi:sugar phosphate permease
MTAQLVETSVHGPTGGAGLAATAASSELERVTIRKALLRLIPFLMICYVVAYLNRVNLSFAALQMNKDLGLTAAAYGLGAGLFFLTYCLCEIPSNLLLHRFGASRWIARIMLTWGVCAVAMAFVRGSLSFYGVRLLLGAAEAGFYPGVLYFITLWFPKAHRGRINGLFLASIPISGILGAPLSGWLLTLNGVLGLKGWQWLFIVEGAPAIFLAPAVIAMIQNSPAAAPWLKPAERDWLVDTLSAEQRQIKPRSAQGALSSLGNPLVLLLGATYFSNVCLLNGITFFLPQIVKGFGLSSVRTGLVVAIPSVIALVGLIWWGRRSDAKNERTGHAALANLVGGAALLLAMVLHDPALRIAAIAVAFACTLAFAAPFWAIPPGFLTGGAAAGGIAAISSIGVTGGLVAPWVIGQLKDMTHDFRAGLGAFACLAMVISVIFYLVARRHDGAVAPPSVSRSA